MNAELTPWACSVAARAGPNRRMSVERWRQGHEDGQQGGLVDEERDLGLPEQGGRVPVAEGGGWFGDELVGSTEAVEELLGRMDHEHDAPQVLPLTIAEPAAGVPRESDRYRPGSGYGVV